MQEQDGHLATQCQPPFLLCDPQDPQQAMEAVIPGMNWERLPVLRSLHTQTNRS